MNANIAASSWKKTFKRNFEKKYIALVIYSYKEVLKMSSHKEMKSHGEIPWEDTRRNMLCEQMRKNKANFGITFNISTESGIYDEEFKDKGRIDICCYLNQLDDQYIAFECKRFLEKDIVPYYIKRRYYGEGIKRFEDNVYSKSVNIGGMIAFLEEGSFDKLRDLVIKELPQFTCDGIIHNVSNDFIYDYVFKSDHVRGENKNIVLFHILMDFSWNVKRNLDI